jgi:serine/threonine protein kinase
VRDESKAARPTSSQKTIVAIGIAYAMNILHENGAIHRDLKPQNILLDDKFYPVLADFGKARAYIEDADGQMTNCVGTSCYMAPEVFKDGNYTNAIDVWSYGMTLFYMLTSISPYSNFTEGQIVFQIMSHTLPEVPEEYSNLSVKHLFDMCTIPEGSSRPSFEVILDLLVQDDTYWFPDINPDEVRNFISSLTKY